MNKVILIGNIGKEPETRVLQSGKTVTTFSIATNKKNKDRVKTYWHRIEYWDMSDGLKNCLNKGSKIAIEGELRYEEYEKDGVKRNFTKIICNSLELLGGDKSDPSAFAADTTDDIGNDDIPF